MIFAIENSRLTSAKHKNSKQLSRFNYISFSNMHLLFKGNIIQTAYLNVDGNWKVQTINNHLRKERSEMIQISVQIQCVCNMYLSCNQILYYGLKTLSVRSICNSWYEYMLEAKSFDSISLQNIHFYLIEVLRNVKYTVYHAIG